MQQQIQQYAHSVRNGTGDPYEGRKLFTMSCALCHKLFGQGAQIGPDLTPYKRDDLDTMLLNIVNPNAEIREGYESYMVTTRDGRTLSGFLADKDNSVAVLRGLDGVNQVLPLDQITEMKTTGTSLMPQGLLSGLSEEQLRDLFAYLQSAQPLVGEPPRR
jgi:putative heme-binding domain-containing protein